MNIIKIISACFIAVQITSVAAQIKNLDVDSYDSMDEAEAITQFDADYKDSTIESVVGIRYFFIKHKYAFIENLIVKHHISPLGFLEYINAQPMRCGVDMPRYKTPRVPVTCKLSNNYTPSNYTNAKLHLVDVLMNAGDKPTSESFKSSAYQNELEVLKVFVERSGGNFPENEIAAVTMDEACAGGNFSVVKYLIEIGVSANSKTENSFYALARSVRYPDIFFYLISKGADYEAVGYNSTTPIIHAAREGCLEVIQFFVDKKVNPYVLHGETSAITSAKKYNKKNSKDVIALLKQVKK